MQRGKPLKLFFFVQIYSSGSCKKECINVYKILTNPRKYKHEICSFCSCQWYISFGSWIIFYNIKEIFGLKKDCCELSYLFLLAIQHLQWKLSKRWELKYQLLWFYFFYFEKRTVYIMTPFLNEDKWNGVFSFIQNGTFPLRD